jgi:hypothetical protein
LSKGVENTLSTVKTTTFLSKTQFVNSDGRYVRAIGSPNLDIKNCNFSDGATLMTGDGKGILAENLVILTLVFSRFTNLSSAKSGGAIRLYSTGTPPSNQDLYLQTNIFTNNSA